MTICQSCNENTTDQLNHTLISSENKITVCDWCYQEIGQLRKVDGKWLEISYVDGVGYRRESAK